MMRSLLTFVLLCGVVSGCAKPHSRGEGGQDGGGGKVSRSQPEQVRAAIAQAITMAAQPDLRRNVFVRFWLHSMLKKQSGVIKYPQRLFPNVRVPANLQSDADIDKFLRSVNFDSPFIKALKINKINYLERGDCPDPEHKHADASVSALRENADLCFSIGNLSRIPPKALLAEILPLLIHETVHLGGALEPEAEEWQRLFHDYFTKNIVPLPSMDVAGSMKRIVDLTLANLRNHIRNGGGNPDFLISLLDLPYFDDQLYLEFAVSPARPEMYLNYANSVRAVIEKVAAFESVAAADRNKALTDLVEGVQQIEANFSAYSVNEGKSVCLLPTKSEGGYPVGDPRLYVPEILLKCSP